MKKGLDDLISDADKYYRESLKLLDSGDIYDAAEKAWSAIESLRKACLVATKIPYEIAKTVSKGLPLFIRILRALGRKDLVDKYMSLEQQLHSLGFYERIIPEGDLKEIIEKDVGVWISEMKGIIDMLRDIDLSQIIDVVEELERVKNDLLRTEAKYRTLQHRLVEIISQKVSQVVSRFRSGSSGC